jgi:hypothetical protein
MLAPRRQPQGLGSIGAKPQDPAAQSPRVKQFTRLCDAIGGFRVRVTRIFPVEPAERGFKSLGIGWLK